MNSSVFFMLAAVLIVAAALLVVISLTRRGPNQLDMDKYRKRWLEIERELRRDDIRSYQMTVLEADKLLDNALKECGAAGGTMGERLKAKQADWTNANAVWSAHKLRNQIVHETDLRLSYDDARRALAGFKRALKDVGAI
jgi:hypothetical protein